MSVVHPKETKSSHDVGPEVRPQVSLTITRGVTKNPIRLVERTPFVIGKATDCDLVLSDPQIGDYHAYILQRDGQVTLRHLGAAPQVTVNGRWIRWGEIKHGDRIRTGPYEFALRVMPALAADNPANSKNPNALGNLSIFRGVSSTATPRKPDDSSEPLCWTDGHSPMSSTYPSENPWSSFPGMTRLANWW